ncbi:MAG: apolipoprotein N-acyltransferase [Ketobacter sp.]|nr:MAG: apolipoprotein N-acyltransferase [Ketobacter sp.]
MTLKTSISAGAKGAVLAFVAGALFPLGLAPVGAWPIIPVSLALLLFVLEGQTSSVVFRRALIFGLGFNGVGVSWVFVSIHYFGGTPAWLAAIGTGAFILTLSLVFFAVPFWFARKLRIDHYAIISFPALWVAIEWSKSWFLSGFPWLWAGYGFVDSPFAGLAPISGVLGLSYMSALCAVFLRFMVLRQRTIRIASACALGVLLIVCWGLNTITWTTPDATNLREVALVQGNIPQQQKWDPAYRQKIFDTYSSLTEQSWDANIILWPEAAYPVFHHQALNFITKLDIKATDNNVAIISGIARWEPQDNGEQHNYNSIFVIGDGDGVYNKQKLVPFGEYVPLEGLMRGLIPFFNLPMSSFNAGDKDQAPLYATGLSFAAFICYEIVYPELVRKEAKNKDFLVTISNDAWFGHSWGPLQHFQMARMRALETGKYIVRGTNNGITAIIDHHGNVRSRLPQFEQGILKGEIYSTVGVTPFVRIGQWPPVALALISLILGAALSHRRAQKITNENRTGQR